MLKAVRGSITTGIISVVTSRPKVVPLASQKVTQSVLQAENLNFLTQEDGFYILLE
jgi:hypothetical protein